MNRLDKNNRNRLSWWFPKIPSDIFVPETEIITCDGADLLGVLDNQPSAAFGPLCRQIIEAGNRLGWPLFLRTDYLSGKHGWKDTCCVPGPGRVAKHVSRLIGESLMADPMGFPVDTWIARKFIPTERAFTAFHGDMPIVKERRYFVEDDKVVCHHPYWPPEAFEHVPVLSGDWVDELESINRESAHEIQLLSRRSSCVGKKIGGSWSIDWLWSEPHCRWYLTDMAEAYMSYHWPECPLAE